MEKSDTRLGLKRRSLLLRMRCAEAQHQPQTGWLLSNLKRFSCARAARSFCSRCFPAVASGGVEPR